MEYQIYSAQLQSTWNEISQNQYFKEIVISLVVIVSFFLGRLAHEKRLTTLVEMVNDADKTRKQVSEKISARTSSLRGMKARKNLLLSLTLFLLAANGVLYYLTHRLKVEYIIGSVIVVVVIWGAYLARVKYLEWSKKKLESDERTISLSAQSELKEIIEILGVELKDKIQVILESELDLQWMKEAKEDCRLSKCHNEKTGYQELYKLYDEIINQIKQVSYCEICLRQENISVQKLAHPEFEVMIKQCKTAMMKKPSLEHQKEIVNRMLLEYQRMSEKMMAICRKGCCIKQRVLIEGTKVKYHESLKKALSYFSK